MGKEEKIYGINQQRSASPFGSLYVVLVAALGIIGLWLAYTQAGVLGKADAVGYAICHRIENRSFSAFGRPLPLCARCTGIYLGAMTGLGVFVASGRTRASYLPHWRVAIFLGLFVAIMGVDGLNSYLTLFPNYSASAPKLAQAHHWDFCGLSLICLVFPIFNQSIWNTVQPTPPAESERIGGHGGHYCAGGGFDVDRK